MSDEIKVVLNQGYSLDFIGRIPTNVGNAEREEERRAEIIEARIRDQERRERQNFKGYD